MSPIEDLISMRMPAPPPAIGDADRLDRYVARFAELQERFRAGG